MALSKPVYIVAARRTAFGAYGGALRDKTATDLAEVAASAALASAKVPKESVNSVIFGNVIQSNRDTGYMARHVALRLGLPTATPAYGVNRLCGSGFQSVVNAVHEILVGDSDVVIAGGSENMSEAPFAVRNVRFGTRFGIDYKFEDVLWGALFDSHIKTPMGITAENLAEKYKLTREECDAFAISSQQRWHDAHTNGIFSTEIAPVTVKSKKGPTEFVVDEHPRQTTVEALGKLAPVFKKDGVVNAGNASGVCDGAGAVIVVSEDALKKFNLSPLARIVGYNVSGCDPSIMGIGPVPAIQNLLKKTNKKISDIDLVEVNEAFAPQYLAVEKELQLDRSKTNVNGGAIALGHPVGASGARITAHLVHELHRQKKKLAIGSACIGGGQGIALLFERC